MNAQHSQPTPLANEQGRRAQLARFGYRIEQAALDTSELDAEWQILKGDFTTLKRREVADLCHLPPEVQHLAKEQIVARRELDRLMEACDAAHLAIRDRGADADLVERYAVARDAYEDAVEAFGERRERLEQALGG